MIKSDRSMTEPILSKIKFTGGAAKHALSKNKSALSMIRPVFTTVKSAVYTQPRLADHQPAKPKCPYGTQNDNLLLFRFSPQSCVLQSRTRTPLKVRPTFKIVHIDQHARSPRGTHLNPPGELWLTMPTPPPHEPIFY